MIAQRGCIDVAVIGIVKWVKLRQRAKFRGDRSGSCRDMAIFGFFKTVVRRRHLGFSKFQMFNSRTAKQCRTASPCQNWSKLVEPSPRYRDCSIFPDSGRRHIGNFNGLNAEEGQTASRCQISSKSVKSRPRCGDFSIFPRWWPSAILDFWCTCPATREWQLVVFITVQHLVGIDAVVLIYACFRFRKFGLKKPIHAP